MQITKEELYNQPERLQIITSLLVITALICEVSLKRFKICAWMMLFASAKERKQMESVEKLQELSHVWTVHEILGHISTETWSHRASHILPDSVPITKLLRMNGYRTVTKHNTGCLFYGDNMPIASSFTNPSSNYVSDWMYNSIIIFIIN